MNESLDFYNMFLTLKNKIPLRSIVNVVMLATTEMKLEEPVEKVAKYDTVTKTLQGMFNRAVKLKSQRQLRRVCMFSSIIDFSGFTFEKKISCI